MQQAQGNLQASNGGSELEGARHDSNIIEKIPCSSKKPKRVRTMTTNTYKKIIMLSMKTNCRFQCIIKDTAVASNKIINAPDLIHFLSFIIFKCSTSPGAV